jgi:hypothetical protein
MGAKRTQALLRRTGVKAGTGPIRDKQHKHPLPLKNHMGGEPNHSKASPELNKKKGVDEGGGR